MNLRLKSAVCIAVACCLGGGCSRQLVATDQVANSPSPTPDNPYADGIKPEGWTIPHLESDKTERTKKMEKQPDATVLEVTEVTNKPVGRVVADLPPHGRGADWLITSATEYSYRSSRPFCYGYKATPYGQNGGNAIGVTTWYKLCDNDGDGLYETRGGGPARIIVPEWAKTEKP
jgi:hypothetical protein